MSIELPVFAFDRTMDPKNAKTSFSMLETGMCTILVDVSVCFKGARNGLAFRLDESYIQTCSEMFS